MEGITSHQYLRISRRCSRLFNRTRFGAPPKSTMQRACQCHPITPPFVPPTPPPESQTDAVLLSLFLNHHNSTFCFLPVTLCSYFVFVPPCNNTFHFFSFTGTSFSLGKHVDDLLTQDCVKKLFVLSPLTNDQPLPPCSTTLKRSDKRSPTQAQLSPPLPQMPLMGRSVL